MKKVWMIIAGVFVVIAIASLLRRNTEIAFVMAAIGAIAWFLNYRVQAKKLIDECEQQKDEEYFDLDEQH